MEEREQQRRIMKFGAEIFHRQKKKKKVAMIEHPVASNMWREPEMCSLEAADNGCVDWINQCGFQ